MTTNDTAVAGGITTMRCDKFRTMFGALDAYSQRTLPTSLSEMKASLLMAAYQKLFDTTSTQSQKLEKRFIGASGIKVDIPNPLGLRDARDKFNATMLRIKLPKDLITKDDLPKPSADDKDAANRGSLAWIIANLGPLYDRGKLSDDEQAFLTGNAELDNEAALALEALVDDVLVAPAIPAELPTPTLDAT